MLEGERDDARGRLELQGGRLNVFEGYGANLAKLLRDNQVRRHIAEHRVVDFVDALALSHEVGYRPVDLGAGEGRRVEAAPYDLGLAPDVRGIVALVADGL